MKASISFLFLLFLLIFSSNAFAQGEAALEFLYLNPSPQSAGLGWTGVSVPNDEAFGFYYNPAMLGYFGQKNNISIQAYPGSIDWINQQTYNYNSFGLNLGYNFQRELNGFNLSLGAGYIYNQLKFSNSIDVDSYNAYGIGASINYFVTLALGITFKNINSNLSVSDVEGKLSLHTNSIDYGFLLIFPVTDLFDNKIKLSNGTKLIPELNYSIGYSRLNIGNEVYYVDPAQSDPQPLTARLGHTINLNCSYVTDNISLKMIDYNLILEADDILIDRDMNNNLSYQGMLGDIDLGKHLIQLKGDDKVVVHKGNAIQFVETVTILKGSFSGRGYDRTIKTDGLIISSSGLFKWLNTIVENNIVHFVANHIKLEYINSTLFRG